MKSTQYLDEPDPSSLHPPSDASSRKDEQVTSSLGEALVYCFVIGFILGIGFLLNEAIRETVSLFRQLFGS